MSSRDKLIDAAADLLQRRGFHGTGMNDVVAESGAPKGSLYFHFPGGKQQLATEAIERSGATVAQAITALLDGSPRVGAAIRRLTELQAQALEATAFERGCPVAPTALDVGAATEDVRAACASSFAAWIDLLAGALRAEGLSPARARREARFALSALEGALILARVERDARGVRETGRELERRLKEIA